MSRPYRRCCNGHVCVAGLREEMAAAAAAGTSSSEAESLLESAKRKTLEDLFRPPLDLMFQGSFEAVSLSDLKR